MRTIITFAALLAACDTAGARAWSPPPLAPVHEDSTGGSTGEGPRLDLGTHEPIPDLPADGSSSTGEAAPTTGGSSGHEGTTSSGEAGSTSSSGGEDPGPESSTGRTSEGTSPGSSSTGEPVAVCGDEVCEPSERANCWAWDGGWTGGFCWPDCGSHPACLAEVDCACSPGAAAVKNFCSAEPLPVCAATAPGGLCSQPQGDAAVFYQWLSKCG